MAAKIDLSACERLVSTIAKSCQQQITVPASPPVLPQAHDPPWDAIATGLSSLSTAFTWGSIALAAIVLLAGVAWGIVLKLQIEKEARQLALECAREQTSLWLEANAPGLIAKHMELLTQQFSDKNRAATTADEMGKVVG